MSSTIRLRTKAASCGVAHGLRDRLDGPRASRGRPATECAPFSRRSLARSKPATSLLIVTPSAAQSGCGAAHAVLDHPLRERFALHRPCVDERRARSATRSRRASSVAGRDAVDHRARKRHFVFDPAREARRRAGGRTRRQRARRRGPLSVRLSQLTTLGAATPQRAAQREPGAEMTDHAARCRPGAPGRARSRRARNRGRRPA